MAAALEGFDTAIRDGSLQHDGSPEYVRHLGNARRQDLPGQKDEQGKSLWLIRKERPDSPHKIDMAAAGVLCRQARTDAIASGAMLQQSGGLEVLTW